MSEETYTILLGLLTIEMLNCKDRKSDYFQTIVKAKDELEEIHNDTTSTD